MGTALIDWRNKSNFCGNSSSRAGVYQDTGVSAGMCGGFKVNGIGPTLLGPQ
jgi:hypothetical protein